MNFFFSRFRGYVTNVSTGEVREVLYPRQVRTLHRKVLLEALAEELATDSIRFSSRLVAFQSLEQGGDASMAAVHLEDGTTIKSKVLIGCDGVHSFVARWLGLAELVHSGRSAVRGLAVFPQGHGFKQEVRFFLDESDKAGFVPLNDRELYWFFSSQGKHLALFIPLISLSF